MSDIKKDRMSLEAELSKEMGLRYGIVQDIVDFQFKFVAKTISSGTLDTVVLPYMGKFTVSAKTVSSIMRRHSEKSYETTDKRRRTGKPDNKS